MVRHPSCQTLQNFNCHSPISLNQHSTQQFLAMETRDPPLPTTAHDFPIFSPTHMHTNSPPNIIWFPENLGKEKKKKSITLTLTLIVYHYVPNSDPTNVCLQNPFNFPLIPPIPEKRSKFGQVSVCFWPNCIEIEGSVVVGRDFRLRERDCGCGSGGGVWVACSGGVRHHAGGGDGCGDCVRGVFVDEGGFFVA